MIWVVLMCVLRIARAAAPVDWIERSPNGAYQFEYATGDDGGHYRSEAASSDNTVAGKYGFRDPGSGGNLETTYTAGRRGFRARGPHIARRMGLSQIGGPSRGKDDGQYHPELDNVFDPTEDRGYDFQFRTRDVVKEEHADSLGSVRGRYSYVDDVGGKHTVDYTAGANQGFNVLNPVPDTFAQAQSSPLIFHGKGPGSKSRGYTAIQKSNDGSYKFSASGPDHKRSEVSDAQGNRRGSYSYLDDKGQQHTVEYIAGPNIGYQVINNRRPIVFGPTPIPTTPYYPDVFPTATPFFPEASPSLDPFFPSSPGSLDWPSTTQSSSTRKPAVPSSTLSPPPNWQSSTPSWITGDFGSLHKELFPEGNFTKSCCGRGWSSGPRSTFRGRFKYGRSEDEPRVVPLRAHVQNIDLGPEMKRFPSPGDAMLDDVRT